MGEYTTHSKFYKPVVGESNANITIWDAALDNTDADIANACSIMSSPNSILWDIIYRLVIENAQIYIDGTPYVSTERLNGGTEIK